MNATALSIVRVGLMLLCIQGFAQDSSKEPLPRLVSFVAPPYPRLARDARMTATTVTHIKVGKDGSVTEAKIVSAHPIFGKYVLAALKQWKFSPSAQEHEFDVTCRFEFYSPDIDECFKPDGSPSTPETIVSATFPADVLVRISDKCEIVTTSDPAETRH